jgi:hypothetical protein
VPPFALRPGDPVAEAVRLYAAAAQAAGPRLTGLAQALTTGYINERDRLQPIYRQALKDAVEDQRPRPSVSLDLNRGLTGLWSKLRQVRGRAGVGGGARRSSPS